MTTRRKARGRFELPTSAADAIEFFTPEGERSWAPGWDPGYLDAPSEDSGTVFVTSHGGMTTIWVIERIDRDASTASYTRVTPGHHAGTVRVRCDDVTSDRCSVTVEYDMTALNETHPEVLEAYGDEPFAAMMNEWATLVSAVLRG